MFGRLATEDHDEAYALIRSHGDTVDPKRAQVGYTCVVHFTASDIADIVGGELIGPNRLIRSVSIDSRSIDEAVLLSSAEEIGAEGIGQDSGSMAGTLFVPVVAERDGHDFIASALENGAVAYLSSQASPQLDTQPTGLVPPDSQPQDSSPPNDIAMIRVEDTMAALTALGAEARNRLPDRVIGVTGSVGKTSVKDLIAAACSVAMRTHANKASFNNELGLPLTLVNAPEHTQVTVLEMGARGSGHIAQLCATGRPTIGVVTRVVAAHTELFGSLDGVAAAKGELIEALPQNGIAVLNADDPLVVAMAQRSSCRVVTYGTDRGTEQSASETVADFVATKIKLDEQVRASFVLQTPFGTRQVRLQISGEHMAANAVAAIAVAASVGVDLDDAVAGIEGATISGLRMEVSRSTTGLVLINDAYNANPTSVRAALKALQALPVERRIAVLGVMAELGEEGDDEHQRITQECVDFGVGVIAVDAEAYGDQAEHVSDIRGAEAALGGMLGSGPSATGILVKGSRVAELERVARWLQQSQFFVEMS